MPAQLPLLDGYEALGMADKGCEKREEEASTQVHPPRSDQPRPCSKCSIKSSTMKKWQWVADRVTPFSSGKVVFQVVFIRNTKVMPRDGATLSEGDKANGSTCATPECAAGSGAHLKCLYTSACSTRNKWDELEVLVLSQN